MKTFLFKNYQQFVLLFWALLFISLFVQFLPQTSVVEALLLPLLFLAMAYPYYNGFQYELQSNKQQRVAFLQ